MSLHLLTQFRVTMKIYLSLMISPFYIFDLLIKNFLRMVSFKIINDNFDCQNYHSKQTMWTPSNKKSHNNNKENRQSFLKTVFLQLEDHGKRPSFPKSMPQKKHREHQKFSLKNVSQLGEPTTPKGQPPNSNTLHIDLLELPIKNKSQVHKKQSFLQLGKQIHSSKTNTKTSRAHHPPRSKTVHTELPQGSSQNIVAEKKLANILFRPSLKYQSSITGQILKSSGNKYVRTTSGRKHKIDGYMYLHKLKTKYLTRQRNMSMIQGQSYPEHPVSRQLLKKKDRINIKKEYYLSTYTNFARKKNNKTMKTQYYQAEAIKNGNEDCRPWSGRESLKSDHQFE